MSHTRVFGSASGKKEGEGQSQVLLLPFSQTLLASNIQQAKAPYLGLECSESCQKQVAKQVHGVRNSVGMYDISSGRCPGCALLDITALYYSSAKPTGLR